MEPTTKSSAIENFLEVIAGRTTAITTDRCINSPLGCGKPITGFKDALSRQEYQISGLCQTCQDSIFDSDEEDEEEEEAMQQPININNLLDEIRYGKNPKAAIAEIVNQGIAVFTIPKRSNIVSVDIDLHKGHVFKEPELPSDFASIEKTFKTTSRNGNEHYWLRLDCHLDNGERSAIAIACGGDQTREFLSMWHVNESHDFAYVMFETEAEAEKLRKWFREWDEVAEIGADGKLKNQTASNLTF